MENLEKGTYLLVREFDTDKIVRTINVTGKDADKVECGVMRNMQLEHYYTENVEIK